MYLLSYSEVIEAEGYLQKYFKSRRKMLESLLIPILVSILIGGLIHLAIWPI